MTTLDVKPVSSAHLLKLSDGRVLLTYGNRTPGNRGIDARLSSDGGRTWSSPQRLIALETGDCGYPDAVELPNGRVLVVYYADGVPEHQRYHMGVINVALDELGPQSTAALDYTIELTETFPPSVEGGTWFQPRAVAMPTLDRPLAVMTIQKSLGSDFFSGLSTSKSMDGGRTWSIPEPDPGLGWRDAEDNLKIGVCDITLGWHAATRKVIGIGHTVRWLQVIRATEKIAVPERGKDLGNFDATNVSASETWITVAGGPAYLARIQWKQPNRLVGGGR